MASKNKGRKGDLVHKFTSAMIVDNTYRIYHGLDTKCYVCINSFNYNRP